MERVNILCNIFHNKYKRKRNKKKANALNCEKNSPLFPPLLWSPLLPLYMSRLKSIMNHFNSTILLAYVAAFLYRKIRGFFTSVGSTPYLKSHIILVIITTGDCKSWVWNKKAV